jgi:hypothetical protein
VHDGRGGRPRHSAASGDGGGGGNAVVYSLSLSGDDDRPDLLWQLDASLESLRRVAPHQHVIVFYHGRVPAPVARTAAAHGATVHEGVSYEARLRALCPFGWQALSTYPLLHKYLNFGALASLGLAQTLLVDCDTLFFDTPDRLFRRYARAHCAAREEPTTRRSALGYDPTYIDEAALARLAGVLGVRGVLPFNTGVMLMRGELLAALAELERTYVTLAWRLLRWMALHVPSGPTEGFGELPAAALWRAQGDGRGGDERDALPYPSANRWILDEVALWLTLGCVDGLQYSDFALTDVAQNGEAFAAPARSPPWVLLHYYSQNLDAVDRWLRWGGAGEGRSAGGFG